LDFFVIVVVEGMPVKNFEWWGAGMEQDADLHVAQLIPLPLTVSCFSKIQISFWHRLTQVIPDKGPLNGCVLLLVLFLWCYSGTE